MVLHPQAAAALARWEQEQHVTDPGFDLAAQRTRARAEAAEEPREEVAQALDVDAAGVPCRWYVPATTEPSGPGAGGAILYAHGGGFVFGDLETHDAQARRLANRSGMPVLAVDYRRPPEHRFPAAPDDVETALHWLAGSAPGLGVDVSRLVVLGDSAGANLVLVAALRNPHLCAAAVLVYPFLDPEMSRDSYRREAGGLGREEAAWYWQQYAARPEDLADPDLAPLRSTGLGTLPPTLVVAAEHDPLRDEDVELAQRLEAAGVPTDLATYPGMVHGFWRHPAQFDAAEESLARIVAFLRRTLG